jgi:hypothetical protein
LHLQILNEAKENCEGKFGYRTRGRLFRFALRWVRSPTEPTKAMGTEAVASGFYESTCGKKHPRLQILTSESY